MIIGTKDNGREFMIGKKIFTLQRNLCDNSWDVNIPTLGWQDARVPKDYSSAQAEEAFRRNFKGGAKRWLANRRNR